MYVDIIELSKIIGSLAVIGGVLVAVYKFWEHPKKQDEALKELHDRHNEDMRIINEEQYLITYGILACLRGLQEKGCNGPVTEAISKLETHLNKQAHDMRG